MEFTTTKWMEILNYLHLNKYTESYITQISHNINISFAYTYNVIDILIEKKLVKGYEDKKNKRIKYIKLTKEGEILALHCFEVIKIRNELMKE